MPFAKVYYPHTKKYDIISTSRIKNFECKDYQSDNEECQKVIHYAILDDEKPQKCLILNVKDTKKAVEEASSKKRARVRKLRDSEIHDADLSKTKTDMINVERLKRKVGKENKRKATEETSSDIVKAHTKAKKLELSAKDCNILTTQERPFSSNMYNNSKVEELQTKLQECEKELALCHEQLFENDRTIASLNDQYNNFKKAKEFNLTEKTGLEIIELLKKISKNKVNDIAPDRLPEETLVFGTVRNHSVYIGHEIWVDDIVYDNAMREMEPGAFITTISYGIWGVEKLANRVCRKQKNVQHGELTPKKKAAVVNALTNWMKKKICQKNSLSFIAAGIELISFSMELSQQRVGS